MRKIYTFGDRTFHMRTFTTRDVMRVTGKLALLPVDGVGKSSAWKSNELADQLLALCSRSPKITLDEPDEVPEGTVPVGELDDATYYGLIKALSQDSGWSAEAAAEIRPTYGTETPS